MAIVLRAIRRPEHAQFVAQLLLDESRWFDFPEGVNLECSSGPTEWNFVAVTLDGIPLGFGRLKHVADLGVLVASYAVQERWRRQGVGRTILGHLHTLAGGVLERGLIASVYADNLASLALCQAHFGPELYRGEAKGKDVVVFGDAVAESTIWPEGEPVS